MTNEEAIELAQTISNGWWLDDDKLETFAKLVEEKVKQENAGAAATLDEMRRRYDEHFAKALGDKHDTR